MRCHAPAHYDEVIRIETSLSSVKSRTLTFDYVIRHADTGQRLVSAQTVLASIDRNGRITSIPPGVRDRLEQA
jgi:acyl-CoA thioester hydrolase